MNLLLVILRRCADGSGNSSDTNLRNALAKGVAGMIKVMDLFYFFQQLYLQMPNKLCAGEFFQSLSIENIKGSVLTSKNP